MAKEWWEDDAVAEPQSDNWWAKDEPYSGRKDVTPFKVSTGDQTARDQESLGILQRERENAQRLAADAQKSGNQADAVRYAGDQAALDREIAARAKTAGVEVPALAPARGTLTLPTRPGQAQSGVVAPEPTALAPQGKAPRMKTGTEAAATESDGYVPVVARTFKDTTDKTKQPGFMLQPGFIAEVRQSFAAIPAEERLAALQAAAKGTDVRARAAQQILLDTQKEDERIRLNTDQPGTRTMVGLLAGSKKVAPAPRAPGTGPAAPPAPVVFPDVTPTLSDYLDRAPTEEDRVKRALELDAARRGVNRADTSIEAIADRERAAKRDLTAEALAKTNPIESTFRSGGARTVSGIANAIPAIVDFAARVTGLAGEGDVRAPTYAFADRLAVRANSLMPEAGKQSMDDAWKKGEFGQWLGLNMIAQAPNIAANFVATVFPPARPFVLPAMGAQTAGLAYGEGDSSTGALLKGGAEIVGERITFGVFDRTMASLSKLPLSLQAATVQSVGKAFVATGKAVTALTVAGAIEESTTQVLANGVDIYVEGKNKKLLDGVAEAAVLGAALEGPLAVPQAAAAFKSGESAFAEALQGDVDARRPNESAIDYLARWEMSANKGTFADNTARMESAARAQQDQARVQQDQADLQQASTAGDAATAADNLSGSLDEMLEPALTGAAVPAEVLPIEPGLIGAEMTAAADRAEPGLFAAQPPVDVLLPEPDLTGVEMAAAADRAEPDLTGAEVSGEVLGTEPALFAPEQQVPVAEQQAPVVTPAVETADINPELEQKMGFDKLRLNAPRPQTIQGTPVANISDDQLQTMAGDESIAPISRRSAAIELTARQAEPGAFTQQAAPQTTGAPSTVSYSGETLDTSRTTFGLGDAQGRVSDAPVTGAGAVARTELQARLDRAAAIHGVAVPTLTAPTPEDEAAVNVIAEALGGVGLVDKVVSYTDPDGADGFELGGVIAVNTETQKGIPHAGFHESFHVAERIAAADAAAGRADTPAQQYVASIHSLFDDMSDAGKRAYVSNFLNKDELDSIQDPVAREARIAEMVSAPKTRSEMSADFMGNRAMDKRFLASLAKADPEGFSGFVTKWVGILDGMISRLKGVRSRSNLESVKVDSYLKDLNQAKMVARDALVAYRKGTLQQLAPTTTPPAMSLRQGEENAPTNVFGRSENIPGAPAPSGRGFSEDGGGPTPTYGTARQGAISVVGRHYSATPRQSLSGAYYGQGLKGAERDRLDRSPDPRLKNRVYFYVDQGAGIRPESGVGGYAHETRLDNIYDPQTRFIKPQADFNAFESAVINAGFDGYIAPFGNGQSAVVLLGQKHKAVPVKAIGQPRAAAPVESAAPSVLKKGLMSKELSQIDTSNIPGARVRAGSLEIPAEQRDAANAELERIGSEVRFAKKERRGEEEPLAKAVKAEGAKATAVVSAKPGREFKIGNDTVSIVTYPKANDLEFVTSRLHARVREALTGSDATNFLAATFGLKGPSLKNLAEIRGLWNTEREDTFAITASKADGSPADFEDSRKLANLLGFALIQEGAVTIEPSHKSNESIPSVLIGKPDGSKLTRSEIDSALSAANDAGFFGASEALSGKGVKFLFFADDSSSKSTEDQYRDFVDQIATVQKSTGLTAAGNFNTNSRLDGANEYWTNATGQSLSENIGGAGNQTASGEPSNIFRGTVDSLLAPYISALSTEGFKFDIKQWQRVFGATDAQASYLKLKLAELDNVNKHGVVPKLRQQVPITNLKQVGSKALITQKTTEANATEQLAALDKVLAGSSNPVKNTEAWLRMEAMAYGTNDVPMAPNRFIKMYNGDGIYEQLKSLSPGQVSDAQQGAEMGQEFRELYESGKVSPAVTAKLMLWSFLSRGVSPYVQESAFVDLVDKIDPFIPRVLNGTFSDDDAAAWNKIVAQTISKGSGQPGAATTHNANAFGGSFMRGMAAAAPNGRTKMQYLHELFSDPTKSGPEIRREFIKMGEGVGIDNKVISFTLLVIGHDDVIVLDRVQIANTFNDGRLGDYNLYDGVSRYGYKDAAGKTVWLGVTPADYAEAKDKAGDDEVISAKLPGSGMANLTTGARGLMIYEPLEGALQKVLPGIFDRLKADGLRSADARPSVGRWHWEGWVAYSGQEASHKTLEALLAEAKGEKNPFADVSAKEGEYGAFSYGTEYARDINGTAYKLYFDSKGAPYRFTLDSYKTLMSELKKKGKDGVVPGNFKVSTNEDGTQRSAPWFKDPRVNLEKFDEMIHRLGTANIKASPTRQTETVAIFAGLDKRGLAKTKAETALAEHPDSEKLKYVQDNFLDILSELDDSGLVKINCK